MTWIFACRRKNYFLMARKGKCIGGESKVSLGKHSFAETALAYES